LREEVGFLTAEAMGFGLRGGGPLRFYPSLQNPPEGILSKELPKGIRLNKSLNAIRSHPDEPVSVGFLRGEGFAALFPVRPKRGLLRSTAPKADNQ
jgi:hypothetical protein